MYGGERRRVRLATAGGVLGTLVAAVLVASPALARPGSAQPAPVTTCADIGDGATGSAVAAIQRLVKADHDGEFGPQTAKALRKWQRARHVKPTGVVDATTWAALPERVARRACSSPVTGTGAATTCATLSNGSTGLAVAVLQRAVGSDIDGEFGPQTQAALEKAQRAAKLPASGTTDRKTWRALKLLGTPVCVAPAKASAPARPTKPAKPTKNQREQARIARHVQHLVAELEDSDATSKNQLSLAAMAFARKQIGKPYRYGGTGPKSYDCSGLQMVAFEHTGITIPRVAADQYSGGGRQISLDAVRQGDLLFYASDLTRPSTIHHVVMYVGNGKVLHAPYTGTDVRIDSLWTRELLPVAVRPAGLIALPLKPGATGPTVEQLQLSLDRHGAKLTVDGGYGPDTQAAVEDWQSKHDLKPDPVVHLKTWLTLR